MPCWRLPHWECWYHSSITMFSGTPNTEGKIFMGDTGSLTIGMMLCFLSLKLTMCGLDDNTGNVHPMVLAFSPLLVPCCDVVRVYLHRVRNGKNPFLPDKNHIHHKLLALGIKQRNTMIIIVSVSTIFNTCSIFFLSLYPSM